MITERVLRKGEARHISFLLSLLCLPVSILFYEMGGIDAAYYMLMASTLLLTLFASSRNIFHMSFLSGHYAFWVLPFFVTMSAGISINYYASFWLMVGVNFAIGVSSVFKSVDWIDKKYVSISFLLYAIIFCMCVLMLAVSGGNVQICMGILIVAAALSMNGKMFIRTTIIYISLFLFMMIYAVFYWGGFGRLVLVGFFMTSTYMYFLCIDRSYFIKPLIILVIPFGAIVGTFFRFNVYTLREALESSVKDSTVTPYVLMGDIYDLYGGFGINDFSGWFDQIMLFFLSVFPRALWPSKPNGFGYQYTIENLDQYLIDLGHSAFALFFGENVYYLGVVWGVLGMFVSLCLVLAVYRILMIEKILGGYGIFVVALWIPTYYWGGMQSFSSRFLMSGIPIVFLFILHKIYVLVRARRVPSRPLPVRRRA